MNIRHLPAIASLFLLAITAAPAQSQELTHVEGLGSLAFPNSGAPAAQRAFLRGVLLLHSFEYAYAAEAFQEAQRIDPAFALAYWGEAMTYNHPVWNQKDAVAARTALNRYAPDAAARAARTPTERERAYLAAIDLFYGEGEKAALDTLYSAAMDQLADAYPDDMEAQTFYALSLLGLSQGDRDVPTYMEAGAIALSAFEKNADHPGAAHYAIHSFDDPTHAVLAMKAARAYGPIAPEAGHAQHMTTHIFLARGMWDDVVEANIRADGVTDRNLAARQAPGTDCGHYNEWLMYGYQQLGQHRAAEELLMGCYRQSTDERISAGAQRAAASSYVYMRNLHLADTRAWHGGPARSEVATDGVPVTMQLQQAWGNGMVAIHRGDRTRAQQSYEFLVEKGGTAWDAYESPYVPVWQGTLNAIILANNGNIDGAIDAARGAAEHEASLPLDFGPPIAFKPARELEGELLITAGQATEAMGAFEMQLARTPNRILSMAGLARAAVAAHRLDIATRMYQAILDIQSGAEHQTEEAREARTFLDSHATGASH